METIKFRGKRTKYSSWAFGSLITCEDGNAIIVVKARHPWSTTHVEVNPKTIGRFTGLHDERNNEIYEGDILKMGNCDFKGVVQWHKNGYFYINEYYPKVIDDDYSPLGQMLRYHMVIIGNIHDNKNLFVKGEQ